MNSESKQKAIRDKGNEFLQLIKKLPESASCEKEKAIQNLEAAVLIACAALRGETFGSLKK